MDAFSKVKHLQAGVGEGVEPKNGKLNQTRPTPVNYYYYIIITIIVIVIIKIRHSQVCQKSVLSVL